MPEKEYIERESLLENLHKFAPEHNTPLIQLLVTREPAADVAEVKRGEWVTKETALGTCCICSVCGSCPTMEYKYCPYCGADMRGDKNG